MREYVPLRRVYLLDRGQEKDDPAYPLGKQSVGEKKTHMAAFAASHNARVAQQKAKEQKRKRK